ncbi:unnamed protein product [Euphydryas editha]|uniref:Gustatory receptor n=1 Tax=Euphydryas editha TaxID=104508 RepID=A0AAU9U319_EUPED|nr:unnamed protein product [Euphydryas editha]
MKASEYISSDMLEESHLKLFSPFRLIQMVLGSCRVDAKYRFVTAPTKGQKIYTIIYLLIILSLYISTYFNYILRFCSYPIIYYLNLFSISIHYGTFACNVIHVRFINNDLNVKFYVRMQDIDRKLKIEKNELINNVLYKANLITVSVFLFLLLLLFVITITGDMTLVINFAGPFLAELTSIFEYLFCTNLLIYFYLRIRYINAILINYIQGTTDINIEKVQRKKFFLTMKVLRYLASKTHDFQYSDTDVYLKNILEEILRFQFLYQFQLFLFSFKFVTTSLMAFEYGIQGLQNNIMQWFEYLLLPTITVIYLIIIIVTCIRLEAFFKEIRYTKYLCIKVLSRIYSGPLRQKAIRMLKMIKEKPPQLSVYGMWNMDTSTMISMINMVTTLMVTLLQFSVL